MKKLFYLLLFIGSSLAAQTEVPNDEDILLKDGTNWYFKNNLGLGVYSNEYSTGSELGFGVAISYKFFTVGGIAKLQIHDGQTQGQAAVLIGTRLRTKKMNFYFSIGPGAHQENGTETIYYHVGNKALGQQHTYKTFKGVVLQLEVVHQLRKSGNGLGGYITVFSSGDAFVIGIGLNFMFGTRQN
jgi:hypothetical protein